MFVALKSLIDRVALRPGKSSGAGRSSSAVTPLDWAGMWLGLMALIVLAAPAGPAAVDHAMTVRQASGERAVTTAGQAPPTGTWVPTQDSWNEQLSKPSFWANRKAGGSSGGWSGPSGLTKNQPNFLPPFPSTASLPLQKRGQKSDDDDDKWSSGGKTFRSFATTKDNFEKDAVSCERSCGGPTDARLFVYRNPGGDIEEMEDLEGKPYKKLQTAFLFRTKYDAQCKCKAHPWEEASLNRHKTYALVSAAQKGDPVAARDLTTLKARMQDEARAVLQEKQTQARTKREAALQEKAAAEAALATAKAAKRAGKAEGRTAALSTGSSQAASGLYAVPQAPQRDGSEPVSRPAPQMRVGEVAAPAPVSGPAASGARTGVVILRYGSRPPIEVTVPISRPLTPGLPAR
jgi:hypothetical protein